MISVTRTTSDWTSVNVGNFVPWTDPGNAEFSDDVYTSAYVFDPENSNNLTGRTFGFSIPNNATINGIVVEIERHGDGFGTLVDGRLRLVKADVEVGENRADSFNPWSTSDSVIVYGGASDLWGTTWAPAEVNDPDFGVNFVVSCSAQDSVASVDMIRITVFYTLGAGVSTSYSLGLFGIGSPQPDALPEVAQRAWTGDTRYNPR